MKNLPIISNGVKNKIIKIKKKIGLLGGIGPEATGEFYLSLISKLQKSGLIKSNQDFPQIIINSIPAPELIYENISREELKPYIIGLKELEKFGVDFIAMVCNTIHLFYGRLQKEIKTPIIDLRKSVQDYLLNKNIGSVTVLGSPNVIKGGLYHYKEIEHLVLEEKEITLLMKAIFDFNRGFDKIRQSAIVTDIAKKYLNRGSELIILGCTEIGLMLEKERMPKLNPVDLLIETIITNYLTDN